MNEFETRLKELFPEIYELHQLAKDEEQGGGGDVNIWKLIDTLVALRKTSTTGSIMLTYLRGKIEGISIKTDVPGLVKNKPSIDNRK